MKKKWIVILAAVAVAFVTVGVVLLLHQKSSVASTKITPMPTGSSTPSTSPTGGTDATPTSTPAPLAKTSTPGPVAVCTTADLSGSLDATGGATAGTQYRKIILTNKSGHACTVRGYPGVSLIDAGGAQLGSPADHGSALGETFTVSPGASAQAAVAFPDPGNFDPGTCSAKSTSLKVYPPNQTVALTIPLVAQYCPGFNLQQPLQVP